MQCSRGSGLQQESSRAVQVVCELKPTPVYRTEPEVESRRVQNEVVGMGMCKTANLTTPVEEIVDGLACSENHPGSQPWKLRSSRGVRPTVRACWNTLHLTARLISPISISLHELPRRPDSLSLVTHQAFKVFTRTLHGSLQRSARVPMGFF